LRCFPQCCRQLREDAGQKNDDLEVHPAAQKPERGRQHSLPVLQAGGGDRSRIGEGDRGGIGQSDPDGIGQGDPRAGAVGRPTYPFCQHCSET
jgi:hypothetical protein